MTKPFLKKIITSIATKSNWVSLAVTLTAPWSRSKRKMEILPFPFHHLLLPPIFFPSLSSLSYRYLHLPPNIIFIQEGHPLRCCQPGGRAWTGQICPTGRHEQCTHSSTTGLAGRALPSVQKNGSAGAAETFRSGSPPAAILLPPLLLHFIWSNYDFCALILPDSYLCVTYFCKTWIKGHNLRNLCCTCSSIFAVSPQQKKQQQNFASTFPAQVQVELMGVGDMGHWETRTLIGFPLLTSAPQCILHPRRAVQRGVSGNFGHSGD